MKNVEQCIICKKKLKISKNENIYKRMCYITGAGQLCVKCYRELKKR